MSNRNIALAHYEACVRANPMRPKESGIAYIERICVIAGGMEAGEGFLAKDTQWFDWKAAPAPGAPLPEPPRYRYTETGARLPYPEDPE